MPSLGSKIALISSTALTTGIVYFVHKNQLEDRAKLHEGIVKDIERQNVRRTENFKRLQEQQELTKAYRRAQKEDNRKSDES